MLVWEEDEKPERSEGFEDDDWMTVKNRLLVLLSPQFRTFIVLIRSDLSSICYLNPHDCTCMHMTYQSAERNLAYLS